ncbi:MAG: efflux transporter outer membrane subunit [Duganella sp.]
MHTTYKTLTLTMSLAVGAALVSGCALQPPYQQPATSATTTTPAYPTGPAYGANQAANPVAAADTGWQNFLLDDRLQALVRIALDNNQDLRVALLRVSQAQAALQLQRSAALPLINAEASGANGRNNSGSASDASRNRTTTHNNTVGLNTSWEIDLFGRLQNLTDAAREQYLASAYGRQAAHILLVSQVAEQYLTMLAYDEQLKVTDETLAAARESYRIVKLQFDTGTTSELDESLAQVTLQQAEANHAAQIRLRAQAENALVLLLGQPLPDNLPAATPLAQQTMLADIPAGLPSDLLLRRPDVLQSEALLRAEYANIGAARAAFFPRISLTAAAGTASSSLSGLFKAGSGAWSLAPELLLPIFDGGARQANLDTARIERDIGVAQYRKNVQTAFREVADGLAARGTYDTELAARTRNVEAQQRRVTLAEMLYNNGINDYLSVLTAKTDLYNAQINLITARQNRLSSLVGLYRALGGGWIERTGDASAAPDHGIAQVAESPAA